MTDQEFKDSVADLAITQNRTDKKIDKLSDSQVKTDAQIAETNKQLAKTSKKVDNPADIFGSVSKSQGRMAEKFFYNSPASNPVLGGARYDIIQKNVHRKKDGTRSPLAQRQRGVCHRNQIPSPQGRPD